MLAEGRENTLIILRSRGAHCPWRGGWGHRRGAAQWDVVRGLACQVGLQPSVWEFSDPQNSGLYISSCCRYHIPSSFPLRTAGRVASPGLDMGTHQEKSWEAGLPPGATPPVELERHTEPSCRGPFLPTLPIPFGRRDEVGRQGQRRWPVVWSWLSFKGRLPVL